MCPGQIPEPTLFQAFRPRRGLRQFGACGSLQGAGLYGEKPGQGGSPNNAQCPQLWLFLIRRAYPLGYNQKQTLWKVYNREAFGERLVFQVTNELRG